MQRTSPQSTDRWQCRGLHTAHTDGRSTPCDEPGHANSNPSSCLESAHRSCQQANLLTLTSQLDAQDGSAPFPPPATTETAEVPGGIITSALPRRDILDGLNWRVLPLLFIGLGVTARLTSFAAHRSLWNDEAMLSLNIAKRPLLDLLGPLWFNQAAPALFLLVTKMVTSLGGVSEWTLRAIPLLCSVLLLPLLWKVGSKIAGSAAGLIGLWLGAASPLLLRYASEVKQYGSDALVTVCVLGLSMELLRDATSRRRWVTLGVGGSVALLASQPSVFVLTAVAVAIPINRRVRQSGTWARRFAFLLTSWALVAAVLYVALYRPVMSNTSLLRYWSGAFLNPGAADFRQRIRTAAYDALVAPFPGLGSLPLKLLIGLTLAGAIYVALRRGIAAAILLAGPYAAVAAASALGKYPIGARLLVFATPLACVLIGAAVAGCCHLVPSRLRIWAFATCLVAAVAALGDRLVQWALDPPRWEDSREVLAGLGRQYRGEPICLYSGSVAVWTFYTTKWAAGILAKGPPPAFEVSRGSPSATTDCTVSRGGVWDAASGRWAARTPQAWLDDAAGQILAHHTRYVWLFVSGNYPHDHFNALFNVLRQHGAVIVFALVEHRASLYRLRLATVLNREPRRVRSAEQGQ
jgi:hypothetical protein